MTQPSGQAVKGSPLMTQVMGKIQGDSSGDQLLGEFESSGLNIGWNRATLSDAARAALHGILERNGGLDRTFELRHGSLLLLHCRMLQSGGQTQITFDGSRRRKEQ
jgi:hypothetical protein